MTGGRGVTHAGVFTVTMLTVLREPLKQWLAARHLVMAQIPGVDGGEWVVVPHPDHPAFADADDREGPC